MVVAAWFDRLTMRGSRVRLWKLELQKQIFLELNKTRGPAPASRGQSPFAGREMSGHMDRRDGKLFAHVVVPHCSGQYADFAKNAP